MACDTCRRRKVRCNDEKPQCDNCTKRALNCTYLGEPGPVKKSRLSQRGVSIDGSGLSFTPRSGPRSPRRDFEPGRLERLESLVHELARQVPRSSDIIDQVATPRLEQSQYDMTAETHLEGISSAANEITSNGLSRFMDHVDIVELYTKNFHCQPLPLFDPARVPIVHRSGGLNDSIYRGLQALEPFCGDQGASVSKDLRRAVYNLLGLDQTSLALAQALCVLILLSIKNEEWGAAQVALGAASRAVEELLLPLASKTNTHDTISLDTIRCAQSVFILECILRRSTRDAPRLDHINRLAGVTTAANAGGWTNTDNNPSDLGVQQYCLQLFLIWSRTVAYLDTFREQSGVKPWELTSEYQAIMQDLYTFEMSLAQEHRVGNLRLEERTTQELEDHRTYWAPWFTMQFLFHAIQALANHPLIHITKIGRDLGFRPPSFSQQTADQARLHAGWVTRLVRACQEKRFEIKDPFVGHLVAAVTTVQLFWMDDRSAQVAREAMDCHRTCETFLISMAEGWPQLRNSVRRLELLAHSAAPTAFSSDERQQPPSGQTNRSKHTAQLDLLLPMFQYSLSSRPLPSKTAPQDSVSLPVNLEFLTPLDRAATSVMAAKDESSSMVIDSGSQAFADFLGDDINIFDTSDILNTTLLDGSLWPGQL